MILKREDFFEESRRILGEMLDLTEKLTSVDLSEFPPGRTVLVIIDMVNGFAREGALQSPRVEALIPEIVRLSKSFDEKGMEKLAFADSHSHESPEFAAYPPHCLLETTESDIVEEIREVGGYQLIPKNSTNGFLEPVFQEWLIDSEEKDHFIVVGDCTDICIRQFAISLKTWFNRSNRKSRVIVPVNAVDTYDYGIHHGDLLHLTALYDMHQNGIELVKEVR